MFEANVSDTFMAINVSENVLENINFVVPLQEARLIKRAVGGRKWAVDGHVCAATDAYNIA